MDHVHIGGIAFIVFGFELLLWLFFFRWLEVKMHDNAIGKAIAFVH